MSKTKTDKTAETSNFNPWMDPRWTDPTAALEAVREATLTSIDALLSLQADMDKAFSKGLAQLTKESKGWAELNTRVTEDSVAIGSDTTRATFERMREEVARFGKAAQA
jgi:hypothetical protein